MSFVPPEGVQTVYLPPKPIDRSHIFRHRQMNLGKRHLLPQAGEKGQEKNLVTDSIRTNHQDRCGLLGLNLIKRKTHLTSDIHLGDRNRACFPRILRSSSRLEGARDFLPESA